MFPFGFLAFVAAVVCLTEDRGEGFGEVWPELFVVGDVEAGVERLVRQSPIGITGVRVGAVRVGQQAQAVMEERAPAGVVLTVLREATVDVRQTRADAVLVPLQGVEVDGVGEVRREQLVGLCFQACPVRGQVRDFPILAGVALVERRIHVSGEPLIGAVADCDRSVGICDQAFCDRDGNRAPGAAGLLRGAAGADEVGVGGAARVGGEIQQHP
ncbi:hypothetical protein [Microbacterium lacticum]|uniref:hypothetical protein n=1 Tax=Microbacterium lacticum TaxID=33885 RepID=UPI001F507911|nr:hypothetical protein [Microbacterium lacticum]